MPWTVLPHAVTCGAVIGCEIPAGAPFWYSRASVNVRRCERHVDPGIPFDVPAVDAALEGLKRNPLGLDDAAVRLGGGRQLSLMAERDPGEEG